jgi:hypothetical protein
MKRILFFAICVSLLFAGIAKADVTLNLIRAAGDGNLAGINAALKEGADINVKMPPTGGTALMWSSGQGRLEVVKLLIEKGADVNIKTTDGITALMEASREGRAEVVKLLLEKGAAVNADNHGETALGMALRNGHAEVAQLLTEKGAVIKVKDISGAIALMWASIVTLGTLTIVHSLIWFGFRLIKNRKMDQEIYEPEEGLDFLEGLGFFVKWFWINLIAFVVGIIIAFILLYAVIYKFYPKETALVIVLGFGPGAVVGYAQWLMLKEKIPISSFWGLLCAIGIGVPVMVAVILDAAGIKQANSPGSAIFYALIGGIINGSLQMLLLRHYSTKAGLWIPISALGWGLYIYSVIMDWDVGTGIGAILLCTLTGVGILWLIRGSYPDSW